MNIENESGLPEEELEAAIETEAEAELLESDGAEGTESEADEESAEIEHANQKPNDDFWDRVGNNVAKSAAKLHQSKMLSDDASQYIVEHKYGPQLILALANDPYELAEVASLSPFQLGEKLNEMASKFKQKTRSKAPAPAESKRGSNVTKSKASAAINIIN